ncbi:hypothetical protein HaLaN_13974 [Haematococcus lacustris]|uniref:Uncharacterized protein n=1 Tax=Haematococcus lacustris TaxID=44745 RepID=A0A699ZDV1_HAELA|nr:hypothetical protein HaLaN_13974 [Haematococcus lacustris]
MVPSGLGGKSATGVGAPAFVTSLQPSRDAGLAGQRRLMVNYGDVLLQAQGTAGYAISLLFLLFLVISIIWEVILGALAWLTSMWGASGLASQLWLSKQAAAVHQGPDHCRALHVVLSGHRAGKLTG